MPLDYFRERTESQENDGETVTFHYTAYPEMDGLVVRAESYGLTPATIITPAGKLYRQPIRVEPDSGPDQWHVIVQYAKQKRDAGSFTLSFDTLGGTVNRKLSIAT